MINDYINIRRINGDYIMEYDLAHTNNGERRVGISNKGKNLTGMEEHILLILQTISKDKIILKSTLPIRRKSEREYSKISKEQLEQIKDFLSKERKDITFKLLA